MYTIARLQLDSLGNTGCAILPIFSTEVTAGAYDVQHLTQSASLIRGAKHPLALAA